LNADYKEHKDITIAVLPFQILTNSEELNNLMFGFTEDLITNLSKFIGLSVISHFSTQHIHDLSNKQDISNLNANYLVTGSFMSQGDKVRINIQLLDSGGKQVVFAGKHIEPAERLLDAEDAVTRQIVNVLQQKIDYNLLSYSYKKKNTNLEAYINWLKGMIVMRKGTAKSDKEARDYFNASLKIDPNYARAHTGLSLSYFNDWSCQLWDRWEVSSKGAQKHALKALELDENDYQALMILGRTYLYTDEFEKAEHCFRKSIRMNPNDVKNLMYIAFLMVYLGYAEEALSIYNKANKLNPMQQDRYFIYGSIIHFELGNFEEAIKLAKTIKISEEWIDYSVFVAAIYYHLDDYKNVTKYWNIFAERFKRTIYKGANPTKKEMIDWLIVVNPFKGKSNLTAFYNYITSAELSVERGPTHTPSMPSGGTFVQKEDMWEFAFMGRTVLLKDAKGYHDVHRLLSEPNVEVHCMDLMGSQLQAAKGPDAIDHKAKASYQNKIKALQADIADAREMNDPNWRKNTMPL
jgi:TolB-like protein